MSTAATGAAAAGGSSREARSMELMQTLDDAWNGQDLATFEKRA